MILKNTWGKYDNMWVIGDIRLSRNPNPESFRVECHSKKIGNALYEGAEGLEKYMQSKHIREFPKIIYSILDEHLKNGTESLSCLELAVQYCIRLGMFDEEYKKSQINAFIEEIKALPEDSREKDSLLSCIGGDANNISAKGMAFIERRVYEDLVREYALPKYLLPDEIGHAFREFFHNLRFTITHTLGWCHIFDFEELPTPSFNDGR